MSIIRVRKDIRYFTASNEPFNDVRLSWETRGLMGYLLSKPNNWEVRMEALENAGPAKNYKIRRMLAEARKYGYMNRIRLTLPGGKFDWITEVFESPSLNPNPSTSYRKSTSGLSTSGKPTDILNTDSQNTESGDGLDTQIFTALSELTGGLNTDTPRLVDKWLEVHPLEKILQAIGIAKDKGARSTKYVDEILIGWEANGYPKTREEKVSERRNGKTRLDSSPVSWLAKKEQELANGNP